MGIGLGFDTCCDRNCSIFSDAFDAGGGDLGDPWVVATGTATQSIDGFAVLEPGTVIRPAKSHPIAALGYASHTLTSVALRVGGAVRVSLGYGTGDHRSGRLIRLSDAIVPAFGAASFRVPRFELAIVGGTQPPKIWQARPAVFVPIEYAFFNVAVCLSGDYLLSVREANPLADPNATVTVSEIITAAPTGRFVAIHAEDDAARIHAFTWSETPATLPGQFPPCPACVPDCELCEDSHGPPTATVRFADFGTFTPFGNPAFGLFDASGVNGAWSFGAIGNCRYTGTFPLPGASDVYPDAHFAATLDLNGQNVVGRGGVPTIGMAIYTSDPRAQLGGGVLCAEVFQSADPLTTCDVPETPAPSLSASASCGEPGAGPPSAWFSL